MRGLMAAFVALFALAGLSGKAFALDPENTIYLDLKDGRVVIELLPEIAPKHAERIKELTREGFYDGIVFHRVIPGFMAQTGDPTGTGMGGSFKPDVEAEFTDKESFTRGAVGMALSGPDTGGSQYFFTLAPQPHLDGHYTVFATVRDGFDVLDRIVEGDRILEVRIK